MTMTMTMTRLAFAAAASLAALSAPASAATFVFTITGGSTGSGTIEATPFSDSAATITAISGIIDGKTITSLRSVNDYVNDNVLLFGNAGAKFTSAGVGFIAGGVRTDLFYNYGISSYRAFFSDTGTRSINFTLAGAEVTAVPEPASWALMIVGFGAVGATLRRRRVAVRYAAS